MKPLVNTCCILSLLLLFTQCEKKPISTTPHSMGFLVTPLGYRIAASRVSEQKGDRVHSPISPDNFQEVTIAQGSGLDGFDAIRVFQDRSGYIVFSEQRDRNEKVTIVLTAEEMTGLFEALNRDKITQIEGSYSSGVDDGVQGFIEIKSPEGRIFCWLDNHFDPIEHYFGFCNRVIWLKIEGARIEQNGIDRQEEYERVFGEE